MNRRFLRARSVSPLRAPFLLLPVLLPAVISAVSAQPLRMPPAETGESATISVDVRLVVLHASVRNKKGDLVSGLQERNFRVYEDGQLQTIRLAQPEDSPVAVGLVIDHSGSMARKRSDVTAAAVAFARSSNPGDQVFIVNFNEDVTLGLPDTRLFSASAADLEAAIFRSTPAGRTALYDAIAGALAHLRQSAIDRKVLVVISDGADNASKHTLGQLLQVIARSDVAIYTIGLFDEESHDLNLRALRQIAGASGGETFLPKRSADGVRICRRIAQEIRTQYTISYSPSNQKFAGEYRSIRVSAAGEHGVKLLPRTRAGYNASPAAPPAAEGRP